MLPRFPSFERHIDRRIRVHGCGEIASRVSGVLQPYPRTCTNLSKFVPFVPLTILAQTPGSNLRACIPVISNGTSSRRWDPRYSKNCQIQKYCGSKHRNHPPHQTGTEKMQNIEYFDVPPPPPGQPRTPKKSTFRADRLTYKEKQLIQEKVSAAKVGREVFWTTGDYPKSPYNSKHCRDYNAALESLKKQDEFNDLWKEVVEHCRVEALKRRKEITPQLAKAASKLQHASQLGNIEAEVVPAAAEPSFSSKRRRGDEIIDIAVISVSDSLLEKDYLPLLPTTVIGNNWVFLVGPLKKQYVLGLLGSISDRLRLYLDVSNLGYSQRAPTSELIPQLNSVYRRYISIRESIFYAVRGWEKDILTFLGSEPYPLKPIGELVLLPDETLKAASIAVFQARRTVSTTEAQIQSSRPPVTVSAAGHVALGRAIQSAVKAQERATRQSRGDSTRPVKSSTDQRGSTRRSASRSSRSSVKSRSSTNSTFFPGFQLPIRIENLKRRLKSASTAEKKESLTFELEVARKAYLKFTDSGTPSTSSSELLEGIIPPIGVDNDDSDVAVTHSSDDGDEVPSTEVSKKD
ncbi:hypothetical protein BC829DRAFT_416635 [Chytridium lagenaria]|nr:hypothetical protein BC829DRAFT_416635 [Chytridium lagenaria]